MVRRATPRHGFSRGSGERRAGAQLEYGSYNDNFIGESIIGDLRAFLYIPFIVVTRGYRLPPICRHGSSMKGKTTKRTVDALDADPSSDVFLWDTDLSGFGVRVKPSGARSFLVAYYAPGLHRTGRRLTLGAYGKLTVEAARKKATTLLARVINGEDPALEGSDERRAAKDEAVAKLFAHYLEEGIGRRKPRTLEFYESLGRLYILPPLGKMPVAKVTHRDAAQLHSSLREKSVTANRVGQLVATVGVVVAASMLLHLGVAGAPWLVNVALAKLGLVAAGGIMAGEAFTVRLAARREQRLLE